MGHRSNQFKLRHRHQILVERKLRNSIGDLLDHGPTLCHRSHRVQHSERGQERNFELLLFVDFSHLGIHRSCNQVE